MKKSLVLSVGAALGSIASPANAQESPLPPIEVADGVTIDPMVAARLRYEAVDQDNGLDDAEALTARLRAGVEIKAGIVSLLADAEGTLALADDYNDTLPFNGIEPFPVVADPENFELNRLQVSVMQDGIGATIGRQRIIFDNARFVGNVGWRQNEQTFDAIRGQASLGPVALDATYAISQRTIFGVDSPNEHFDGDFVFLNGGVEIAGVDAKAFAYLIDYDDRIAFSSQTYGLRAAAKIDLPGLFAVNAEASFATQSDYRANPVDYSAPYYSAKLGATVAGFGLTIGYEELGSDGGLAAFQTPMATLHAFNGWADVFLTTPAFGVRDYYLTVGRKFSGIKLLPGLNANVTYHQFDSDFGNLDLGSEWDASLGFKAGPVSLLAKYANYRADAFAVDTEKLWLQAEFSF